MPVSHTSARSRRNSAALLAHEAEQVFRAALLLAFDHHRDVERKLAGHRLEGAASLDKGHRLALVVAGAARDDDFPPAVERLDARLERRRLPQIERIDRLHVVMAVEQHARRLAVGLAAALPVAALADDDRVAVGRSHARLQAEAAQVGRDMFGRGTAVRRVGRVGRDRLDAQERKQPIKAGVEIAVDAVEHRRESFGCGHGVTVRKSYNRPGVVISTAASAPASVACLQRSPRFNAFAPHLSRRWADTSCHAVFECTLWQEPAESAGGARGNGRDDRTFVADAGVDRTAG